MPPAQETCEIATGFRAHDRRLTIRKPTGRGRTQADQPYPVTPQVTREEYAFVQRPDTPSGRQAFLDQGSAVPSPESGFINKKDDWRYQCGNQYQGATDGSIACSHHRSPGAGWKTVSGTGFYPPARAQPRISDVTPGPVPHRPVPVCSPDRRRHPLKESSLPRCERPAGDIPASRCW